jgi:carbon starvation protein CstA
MSEKLLRFGALVVVFLFAWDTILFAIFGVAFAVAILLTIYEWGGGRALSLTAVIIAAFAALIITIGKRGEAPELVSWFKAQHSRRERWVWIVIYTLAAALLFKGVWNIATDPPDATRDCIFCPLRQLYKPPPPPEPPR